MSEPVERDGADAGRRGVLGAAAGGGAVGGAPAAAPPQGARGVAAPPGRTLGRTGALVEAVSLGGEGILRTTGRPREAVPVILEALRLGVRYCDTAPAYQQSQDYYGEAFRAAGPKAREQVFLASKTHARDRDGALRLLDDSLRRLGTDHLDLWQLHDLRERDELDAVFGKGGAIEAVEQARADGRVRHVGITGHHDPEILVEAMRRYPVDTVLCAINPADPARLPFLTTVVQEARQRGVGVIGMKIMAAGRLLQDRAATPAELIRYAASHADTVIIGCSSIAEVRENLGARSLPFPMPPAERAALEARVAPRAGRYDSFKA
ncbi:aldo/keto reductase [Sorangium cellulosum]|uniref:Aldo/keto reductase n=1 Tax=Sorangium cellulosum TaxID=56 RepID=A0A2L0EUB4_SORCE|nr:aldo/keto reductase [Sorangium cellulosum]AUX42886.1 aldo/keto reductase [Sorangium cellulosum]